MVVLCLVYCHIRLIMCVHFLVSIVMFMQAQFAQMRPVTMPPSVAPRMPMYPPGGPGMGQQIFYGQGPPAIIPSQVSQFIRYFCSTIMN
jgi:hypothetical protein